MASSAVDICNMALRHLAVTKEIGSITEGSQESKACNRFYDIALESTLRDFPWPFATQIDSLALVEEDPNSEWDYSYRIPSGCVKFRRILSGTRNDTRSTRVAYRIAYDASGAILLTDQEDAEGEWTILNEDEAQYPPDFVMALSLRIAVLIAPSVTGGDPFKLGERVMGLYQQQLGMAGSNAANEEQAEVEPDSEFIRARE